MILTNNNHRFIIIHKEHEPLFKIDTKNKTILDKYQFNYAKDNPNVLVVTDKTYAHIMIEIGESLH